MLIRVLVLALIPLLPPTPAHAANQLYLLPGFLGDALVKNVPAILAWTRTALDPARFGFKPNGTTCRQFNGSDRR